MVNAQLSDFYEAELQNAFGSRMNTSEMSINRRFIEKLRPIDENWDECDVWRFYEGNYHGTHFSAANVGLYVVIRDQNGDTRKKKFEGVVLRCKDICGTTPDIALRGSKKDHHKSDITDPTAFSQHFSARTADDQPADYLVTPQLRELIQKLESPGDEYTVNTLIFRNGEAMLVISGYAFAEGLPSGGRSLRNLDAIRSRFKDSLAAMGDMIDILRDSCGEL